MITVYGIKNCDTVKKARRWLDANHLNHHFHDIRVDGLTAQQVSLWAKKLGWQILMNRRSTTWRKLSGSSKTNLTESRAIELMVNNPTLIKRPVIQTGKLCLVGFSEEQYQSALLS